MELILKQDVQNLGFKDDVVTVKMVMVVIFNHHKVTHILNFFRKESVSWKPKTKSA
jgi:hypothetical protein